MDAFDPPPESSAGAALAPAPAWGFSTSAEVRAALFAVARDAFELALSRDADPDPAHALAASRRRTSLARRIDATADDGPPLAVALRRWNLSDDERCVCGAALAVAIDPVAATLCQRLVGSAARPGLTVELAAAIIGDDAGVIAIDRMLSPGSPVHDCGLLVLNAADVPFLYLRLDVHRRLIALAAGARAPEGVPLRVMPPPVAGPTHFSDEQALALRALASRHAGAPVLGWLVGHAGSDLVVDLGRLVSLDDFAVVSVDLSLLAEEHAAPAIVREALLARAVVAVRADIAAAEHHTGRRIASALERIAAAVPTYMVVEGVAEPLVASDLPRLVATARPSGPDLRTAALAAAAGHRLTAGDIERVGACIPGGPALLSRIGAPLSLLEPGADGASDAMRVAAEQHGAPVAGPLRIAPPPPEWDDLAVSDKLNDELRAIRDAWLHRETDRLVVLLQGPKRSDLVSLAARVAADIGMRCLTLDAVGLIARPGAQVRASITDAAAAARCGNVVVVHNRDQVAPGTDAEQAIVELVADIGLFIVALSGAVSDLVRRMADVVVSVPPIDHAARTRLWRRALIARDLGTADAEALAAQYPLSPKQIARVAALAGPSLEDVWACAAEHAPGEG